MSSDSTSRAERVSRVLAEAGLDAAVLSSIPAVAQAAGFWPRWEMWPGESSHTLDPTLCLTWPDRDARLLLPNYYAAYEPSVRAKVRSVPSYSYLEPVDKLDELGRALADELGGRVDRLGWEPRTLPALVRDELARRVDVGEWVDVSAPLAAAAAVKTEDEIEGIRRAAAVADTVQQTVKERAEAGRREIDVAGDALAAAWGLEGRRFPILIQLRSGPATALRGEWHPGARLLERGDVVCTDTAPWLDGLWADSCNGVAIGEPTATHREAFAVAAEALGAGIEAVRPGVEGREVDRACRRVVGDAGHEYNHHTGHGLGYVRAEAPRITPTSEDVLEEGMVIALEPGVYIEGWGGFRHEHIMAVRAHGAELLTRFEHTH
jgi:Xaa-Pro aminopeptidase